VTPIAAWAVAGMRHGPEWIGTAADLLARYTSGQLTAALAVVRFRELRKTFSDADAIEQAAAEFGLDPERLHAAAVLQNRRQVTEAANEIANLSKRRITTRETSAN
jgi:hypothetical protein